MTNASRKVKRRAASAPATVIAPGLTRNEAIAHFVSLREHQRICHERGHHALDARFDAALNRLAVVLDPHV